jgi:ABC-type tungstate transport system permease subunit
VKVFSDFKVLKRTSTKSAQEGLRKVSKSKTSFVERNAKEGTRGSNHLVWSISRRTMTRVC